LPTPSFRDNNVASGRRYWYTVTAVDRAGNESPPSAASLVEVP
jgi:chitodextrinase